MPIRLPTDDGPSEKDSFLPTTDVKRPSSPPPPAAVVANSASTCRARKAFVAVTGSLALGLLALYSLASCDGPHRGAWGEVREGWGMVRHGRGSRWGDADRHGFDGLFGEHEQEHKIDWFGQSADLPSLALTAPVGSNPVADVSFTKGTRHVVVALGPDASAEIALVSATADDSEAIGLVSVEVLNSGVKPDAIRLLGTVLSEPHHNHHEHIHHSAHDEDTLSVGLAGVVIRDAGRYLITVALPPAGFGRPIDLTLQGDRLSLAGGALDFAGFRLGRFQLTSSTGADAVVENLHAHDGAIRLDSGSIKGSFNVSGELVLTTLVGAIDANVSIFEVSHHKHKHGKHNDTASPLVEAADQTSSPVEVRKEHKEKPHHPPPHDGPHPHPPPPHHRPKHLVKVLAKTGIGAIGLTFVDEHLPSNETSLLAVAKSQVGDVVLSVLPGFKGVFAEGARIGEVAFDNPGGSKLVIDKEKHTGPGGFIKGFVGERPKHHHHHDKHPEHPKEPKEDLIDAELYPNRQVEEGRLGRHRLQHARPASGEEEEHRPEKRTHHKHSPELEHGGQDGDKPHHPPPCHPPPHGPPPHGPPPPGYGFSGAFTGTGAVKVIFR